MTEAAGKSNKYIEKFLGIIEKVGNKLPHPTTLFAMFALGVIILSWIVSQFNFSVLHPGTGLEIKPVNLLSIEGLHRIILNLVTNFTSFAPL
jgi:aminobenzoyl-glutamate transport protein